MAVMIQYWKAIWWDSLILSIRPSMIFSAQTIQSWLVYGEESWFIQIVMCVIVGILQSHMTVDQAKVGSDAITYSTCGTLLLVVYCLW